MRGWDSSIGDGSEIRRGPGVKCPETRPRFPGRHRGSEESRRPHSSARVWKLPGFVRRPLLVLRVFGRHHQRRPREIGDHPVGVGQARIQVEARQFRPCRWPSSAATGAHVHEHERERRIPEPAVDGGLRLPEATIMSAVARTSGRTGPRTGTRARPRSPGGSARAAYRWNRGGVRR